jgi:hypothetical protein
VLHVRNPFGSPEQAFPYSAAAISRACGGTGQANAGGYHAAACPCHDDHQFSLSVWDTSLGVRVKCFAGCSPTTVKAAIRALMQGMPLSLHPEIPARPKLTETDLLRIVTRIVGETVDIAGTLAEQRIRDRAITIALPPSLRFHPALWYAESRTSGPAMVALVQTAHGALAGSVHRTWVDTSIRMSLGPVRGHAVHIGQPSARLIVGEGIETALAALQLWGPSFDAWAALSSFGVAALIIPESITEVVVAADNDDPGRKAATTLHARLLRERPTLAVRCFVPGNGVKDFNDTLRLREVA